ncbi:heterokaryon incompatibility protein-domain-containing protein [Cercophora samala]|uniref:Heterokaryon incompatibility protein-domain-containing protein n=1 Tax=Cercophora samala TaxID=330535 RepID=A0AA39ZL24_9PEZI|nr:heterokaryon incompatibility protein-domain-containing protein [Cercophora samala]
MSDDLCTLCSSLSTTIYEALPNDAETTPLSSLWHTTLGEVYTSSLTCRLCAIVIKGWSQYRVVQVERATLEADYDTEYPPADLHSPIHEIPAYRDNAELEVSLTRLPRYIDDGRSQMGRWVVVCDCHVRSSTSFDVHPSLQTHLNLTRLCDEGEIEAVKRDAVYAPEELQVSQSTPETETEAEIGQHTSVAPLVSANPLSKQSLTVARTWLNKCVNEHGRECQPLDKPAGWLPSRLLKVASGRDRVFLRATKEIDPDYGDDHDDDDRFVALSHCWGAGGTPFMTTRGTLALHTNRGIEISELPQTFRDAVVLVASLGLRYLWIDSLCILQDDAQDWAREAAQMADIYRYAHLVIIAANSPGDTLGFLSPRETFDAVPLPQPPASPSSSNKNTNVKLCLQLEDYDWTHSWKSTGKPDHLRNEPLSSRAWCLQERFLPLRALQYGTRQAFWECNAIRANEDGKVVAQNILKMQQNHATRLAKTANRKMTVFAKGTWRPADREVGGGCRYNWVDWYWMVQDFTARDITKSTDRFPAVAGLAREVVRLRSKNDPEIIREMTGEYMAGLWKSGVLEGLFWCRAGSEKPLEQTKEYVAPSWSWASVVGQVEFPVYEWYEKRAAWKSNVLDFEPLAEYVSHALELRDHDPFGRLAGGTLTMNAPLLPVTKIKARQEKEPPLNDVFGLSPSRSEVTNGVYRLQTENNGSIWIEGGMDVTSSDGQVESDELVAMLLIRVPHVLDHGFVDYRSGLLLKRLDDGCFQRVGFIDGAILKETGLPFFKSFEVVGYPRPYEEGDMDTPPRVDALDFTMDDVERARRAKRHNHLALDPLKLEKQEVTIC